MSTLAVRRNYDPVIVDVREPAEFEDLHLYGAINIPSTKYSVADYEAYRSRPIHLVCNTGRRVKPVKEKLEAAGFKNVQVNDIQMQAYSEKVARNVGIEGSWTVDRQFRLTIGIMLYISLLGSLFLSKWFLVIAGVICTSMTFTALIDRCYFKMVIAWMPWNRR